MGGGRAKGRVEHDACESITPTLVHTNRCKAILRGKGQKRDKAQPKDVQSPTYQRLEDLFHEICYMRLRAGVRVCSAAGCLRFNLVLKRLGSAP